MPTRWTRTKERLRRFARREDGTQLIELAIVLPTLILLFAAATELGRMFYTYTTLAKSTRAGARYLSSSKDFSSGDATKRNNAIAAAKNLVVCGRTTSCANLPPAVHGLSASNVTVDPLGIGLVRYSTVSITGYTYRPVVFDLNALTGSDVFSPALQPSTRMRYMP